MSKKIRDPIYGYITIEDYYLDIINSINFQRLRNIIQTSYTSVYPSALHNRFTHSLGVFWLGKLVFKSLRSNSNDVFAEIDTETIDNIEKTFVTACLCHDIGHSPFSHTGEILYDKKKINHDLIKEVNNDIFSLDLKNGDEIVGKEHEIMSALLSIRKFGENIKPENFSFFSRCIIGLKYSKETASSLNANEFKIFNACIEMLNSDIIDVDKLDYLIRDSYMSGYSSVSIDYERLLGGVFICEQNPCIGYEKSSLSVLETVLTAHDMERRWIQSHPTIQYDGFLLETIMRDISLKYNTNDKTLLSYETLTEEGIEFDNIGKIRLLCDADILSLAKRDFDKIDSVKEYCDRSKRLHPIWKSEAEFSTLFQKRFGDKFYQLIENWEKSLRQGEYSTYCLNDVFLEKLQAEKSRLLEITKAEKTESIKNTYLKKIDKLSEEIQVLSDIKNYFDVHNIPFQLVVITNKYFKSNIQKDSFKNLPIRFRSIGGKIDLMKNVTKILLDIENDKNNRFFYLYYNVSTTNKLDVEDFSKALLKAAVI